MPIEVSWFVPDKILLSRWIGDISGDDMHILIEELAIILERASGPVHSVIDVTQAGMVSPDAIYAYLQSAVIGHPNRGRIGMVGTSFQAEVFTDMANRITQREMIRLFPTRAAAREFLLLNDSPPPPLNTSLSDIQIGDADPLDHSDNPAISL